MDNFLDIQIVVDFRGSFFWYNDYKNRLKQQFWG